MTIAFSTDHLAQRDRIPFWVATASKVFFSHGFNATTDDFTGRLDARSIGTLNLARCDCTPCEVTRDVRDVARDRIDDYILSICLGGRALFSQDERRVVINSGTVFLQDTARPMRMEFLAHTTSLCLSLPREEIETRVSKPGRDRVLDEKGPMTAVTGAFIRALADHAQHIEPGAHQRLADQTIDLAALAFGETDKGRHLSAPRDHALQRLKSAIEKRLRDPDLKPADAARAAGISVRYANLLLAGSGISLERYILRRRLEQCKRSLEDPLQAHRMIGEIAFSWGFSDHSHFTRRFRSMFEITPGDCRHQALLRTVKAPRS